MCHQLLGIYKLMVHSTYLDRHDHRGFHLVRCPDQTSLVSEGGWEKDVKENCLKFRLSKGFKHKRVTEVSREKKDCIKELWSMLRDLWKSNAVLTWIWFPKEKREMKGKPYHIFIHTTPRPILTAGRTDYIPWPTTGLQSPVEDH